MKYGTDARVGSVIVFTRDGAIEAFKKIVKLCYRDLTMESSCALSDCANDMRELGFSREEIEAMEIQALVEARGEVA